MPYYLSKTSNQIISTSSLLQHLPRKRNAVRDIKSNIAHNWTHPRNKRFTLAQSTLVITSIFLFRNQNKGFQVESSSHCQRAFYYSIHPRINANTSDKNLGIFQQFSANRENFNCLKICFKTKHGIVYDAYLLVFIFKLQ